MDVIVSGARSILNYVYFCFVLCFPLSAHFTRLHFFYDCLFSVFIDFILLAFVRWSDNDYWTGIRGNNETNLSLFYTVIVMVSQNHPPLH